VGGPVVPPRPASPSARISPLMQNAVVTTPPVPRPVVVEPRPASRPGDFSDGGRPFDDDMPHFRPAVSGWSRVPLLAVVVAIVVALAASSGTIRQKVRNVLGRTPPAAQPLDAP
jgi:hypothetical protein